jgi:hypothetical protein
MSVVVVVAAVVVVVVVAVVVIGKVSFFTLSPLEENKKSLSFVTFARRTPTGPNYFTSQLMLLSSPLLLQLSLLLLLLLLLFMMLFWLLEIWKEKLTFDFIEIKA